MANVENGTAFSKIYSSVGKAAGIEGIGHAIGLPYLVSTLVAAKSVYNTIRKTASQSADAFINSKKFTEALNKSVRGDTKGAEATLNTSAEYRKWLSLTSDAQHKAILRNGFIGWLSSNEEQ